jgi:hypothetical protein
MKTIPALALSALLGACATFPTIDQIRQDASSGHVGCRPSEVAISENQQYTWVATCKGKAFQCTGAPDMACKELRP